MFALHSHFSESAAAAGDRRTVRIGFNQWREAWRAAVAAEKQAIALSESRIPRAERGRRIFQACFADRAQ